MEPDIAESQETRQVGRDEKGGNGNEMLTPTEVSAYLKVPISTVWRWCRKGTLPALKIGKYWRIPRRELDLFISSQTRRPQTLEEARGASI